jgi:hypothetical protein
LVIVITDEEAQIFGQSNQLESNFGQRTEMRPIFGRETLGRFENFDRENIQTQSFGQKSLQESNLRDKAEMASNFNREIAVTQNFGSKVERAPEFDRRTNEPQAFVQGNQTDKNMVSRNDDFNQQHNLDREYVEATKMASTIDELAKETNFGRNSLPIMDQNVSKAPIETEQNRNIVANKRPYEEPITNHQGSWQSRLAAMDKGPANKMDSSTLNSRANAGQSGFPATEGDSRQQPQSVSRQNESSSRFNTPASTKAPNAPPGTFLIYA